MVSGKTKRKRPLERRILETALGLAEEQEWQNVRLSQVADRLKISLLEIHDHYRDMDDVANAWFGGALDAMLSPSGKAFSKRPPKDRLRVVLVRWLDFLAEHREVTTQMVASKLYPAHVHHWAPLVFNLSRLVHWWLDAAAIVSRGRQRQIEEIGLTALFLATVSRWGRDDSSSQERTKYFLERRLNSAEACMARLFPPRQEDGGEGKRA